MAAIKPVTYTGPVEQLYLVRLDSYVKYVTLHKYNSAYFTNKTNNVNYTEIQAAAAVELSDAVVKYKRNYKYIACTPSATRNHAERKRATNFFLCDGVCVQNTLACG